MGLAINASMPTSNVYNSVASIYNFENTLNNIREHGAFMNFAGTVTSLATSGTSDLYDQNQAPDRHILVVMSIDQACRAASRVNYRIRASGPSYGFYPSALFTAVGCTITNVTVSSVNYIRLTNTSGATKTFHWSVVGI